jgi:hypothetical protein
MAWLPPAVFSSSTGTSDSSWSSALRQRTKPSSSSPPSVTWPPWTITPAAPTAAAPLQVSARSLREGMRMRLFGEARLIP